MHLRRPFFCSDVSYKLFNSQVICTFFCFFARHRRNAPHIAALHSVHYVRMNFLPSPTVCDHTHENAALSSKLSHTVFKLKGNLKVIRKPVRFFHKYSFGRFLIVFWSAFCVIRAYCGLYDCYIFSYVHTSPQANFQALFEATGSL